MAAREINAKDILLFKGDSADDPQTYLPVGCLTNLTVGRSRSTSPLETKCGTLNSEGSTTYTAGADTVIIWGNEPTAKIEHRQLVDYFNGEARQAWKIAPAEPQEGDNIIAFTGTISALNDTAGATGFATASITFNPENDTWLEVGYVEPDTDVTLSTIAVPSGSVTKNTSYNILYEFKVDAHSSGTLNSLNIGLSGTFASGDLGNLTILRSLSQNMASPGIQQTISGSALSSGANVNFNAVNTAIDDESVVYFAVAVDIASAAVTNHTIIAAAPNVNLTSGGTVVNNIAGSGGTKTIA